MNVLVEVGHPAALHTFRNMMVELRERGHRVRVAASDKDIAIDLIKAYGFDYDVIYANRRKGLHSKLIMLLSGIAAAYRISAEFKPDIYVSRISPISAVVSRLRGKRHIGFDDSEHAKLVLLTASPFTDVKITPECFGRDLGPGQIRISTFKELAYLHPNRFRPDPSVLDSLGLTGESRFVIMRFVAWNAAHDDRSALDDDAKVRMARELGKHARVFITSESPLPPELEPYRLTIPCHRIHDLLYYAQLIIGDSGTMTTEAAVLGVPAVWCSTFVGRRALGNFRELEEKYGLIFNCRDPEDALRKALELLQRPGLKEEWKARRERLLMDKIDLTSFMVWFVENYPESYDRVKAEPGLQYRFR